MQGGLLEATSLRQSPRSILLVGGWRPRGSLLEAASSRQPPRGNLLEATCSTKPSRGKPPLRSGLGLSEVGTARRINDKLWCPAISQATRGGAVHGPLIGSAWGDAFINHCLRLLVCLAFASCSRRHGPQGRHMHVDFVRYLYDTSLVEPRTENNRRAPVLLVK